MTSFRKTALVAGILYLITFLGSIPAAFLVAPGISEVSYLTGAGADRQVTIGAVLELVNVFGCIACGVALFSVIRRVHEGLAIGYVATRLFEAAIITVGVLSLLAVVTLRQQGAATGDPEALVPVGQGLIAVRYWAMIIGGNMAAFNALMLGTAFYRARLVPRAIPALGIVGAPHPHHLRHRHDHRGHRTRNGVPPIAVMPFFIWELVLGLWLTFKGFNENRRRSRSTSALAEPADAPAPGRAPSGIAANAGAA